MFSSSSVTLAPAAVVMEQEIIENGCQGLVLKHPLPEVFLMFALYALIVVLE